MFLGSLCCPIQADDDDLQRSAPELGLRTHVCLLSSHGVATVVMKNWEPFVFGPAFAEDSVYGRSCVPRGENSSSNSPPHMLSPLLPVPVGSPP